MTHAFETLETSIVSALAPLLDEGVRTIKAYEGELDFDAADITISEPFILVDTGEMESTTVNNSLRERYSVYLLVGARHYQSRTKAGTGTTERPLGIWDVLDRIKDILAFKNPMGKPFDRLELQSERGLGRDPRSNLAAYVAEYRCYRPRV